MQEKLSEKVNRLNKRIWELDVNRALPNNILRYSYLQKYKVLPMLFEEINNIDVSEIQSSELFDYIEKKFSGFSSVLPIREKLFMLKHIENIGIDLNCDQMTYLIDQFGENLHRANFRYYVNPLYEQSLGFDLEFWEEKSKDLNFLDFITTRYTSTEYSFMAYTKHELINIYETLCYAADKIPSLKPYVDKIVKEVIDDKLSKDKKSFYPFRYHAQKDFINDYIMKANELSDELREFVLSYSDVNGFNKFSFLILVSEHFSEEEKLQVIEKMEYDQFMSNMLYYNVFSMREYLRDEYESIDVYGLFNLDKEEMRLQLEEAIDAKKVPNRYSPYYYYDSYGSNGFAFKKGSIPIEQLKSDYIENFIQTCEAMKKLMLLKPYELEPRSKIIKVTDGHSDNHNDLEQEEVFKKAPKEKVFLRDRRKNVSKERK